MYKIFLIGLMLVTTSIYANEESRTEKTAQIVCSTNSECMDLISIQLDGMYYQGLNEKHKATIGTLINRKSKEFSEYCNHAQDKKTCENYKNQLMLKYMTGLLDR